MRSNVEKYVLAGLVVLFLIPDTSDAGFFRRRRNRNSGGGGFVSTPVSRVTKPIVGLIRKHSGINRNEYDYNWAARRDWHKKDAQSMLFADKVRVKVLLNDTHAKNRDDLRVRASWVYMHKSKTWHTAWVDLQQDGDDVYYELDGLQEGRVVKVITDLYLKTDQQPPNEAAIKNAAFIKKDEGTFKYAGRMHVPYYGVTSSEDNEEFKRRARIISFSFSQWYADEAYGGRLCSYDCYSFYQSSAGGELNGFKLQPVAHSNVAALAKKGKRFHGDYLIMPGHYGMGVCYDEDTGRFCSIEGNYALNGPYRINIDQNYHGLYTWSSIMSITEEKKPEATSTTNPL